jgi:hypothetical protein
MLVDERRPRPQRCARGRLAWNDEDVTRGVVRVDVDAIGYMGAHSGAGELWLVEVDDPRTARSALEEACSQVLSVPHPDEPTEPMVSFVSAIESVDDRLSLWFDAADAEAYEGALEAILERIVVALEDAGVSGRLTHPPVVRAAPPGRRPFHAIEPVAGLPADFPLPARGRLSTIGRLPESLTMWIDVEEADEDTLMALMRDLVARGYEITKARRSEGERRPGVGHVMRLSFERNDAHGDIELLWPERVDDAIALVTITVSTLPASTGVSTRDLRAPRSGGRPGE